MKHVNALNSSSALVFIVVELLRFIMIGNKKQGVGFEDRLGPFDPMMHQGPISQSL
jgi:hypothetical protein